MNEEAVYSSLSRLRSWNLKSPRPARVGKSLRYTYGRSAFASEPDECFDEFVHAAAGVVEPVLGEFGVGQEGVDRRGLKGREPKVHRLERKRLPEFLRSEVFGDGAVVVAYGSRLQQKVEIARAEEVCRPLEVALDELFAPEAVLEAGVLQEAVEAGGDAGLYPF